MTSVPLALTVGLVGLLLQLVTKQQSFALEGLPGMPAGLTLVNVFSSQWIVFAGFGIALLLTAWLAVMMLKGIDEAIFSDTD